MVFIDGLLITCQPNLFLEISVIIAIQLYSYVWDIVPLFIQAMFIICHFLSLSPCLLGTLPLSPKVYLMAVGNIQNYSS